MGEKIFGRNKGEFWRGFSFFFFGGGLFFVFLGESSMVKCLHCCTILSGPKEIILEL